MGCGTGSLGHWGLPSSAPTRGWGGFVRGCKDLLQSRYQQETPVDLEASNCLLRESEIKEICEAMFGETGPAQRWLLHAGSMGDGRARAAALPCPGMHREQTGMNPTKWDEINKAAELF